jgi:hypothetical protein
MSDDPGSGTTAGGDEQAANAGAGSGPA